MIGYKLLYDNVFAKGIYDFHHKKFEIGEELSVEGKIKINKQGFHFCPSIEDTFIYNSLMKNAKLYEVDTLDGEVIIGDTKCVSSKIKVIREIPLEEIKKYIEDNLERLVTSDHFRIRAELARLGYSLALFVHDLDYPVRVEVARRKYGLDILINDESELVRREVALAGYGLEILENDKDFSVRLAVDMYRNNKI